MTNDLQLGTAKLEITPQRNVPLAGFAHRQGVFEGIRSPLFLRTMLYRQETPGQPPVQLLLVSADIIWWGPERLPQIRKRLAKEQGLSENSIMLVATHNHSAPQTSNRFTPSLGIMEEDYVCFLEEQLFKSVHLAAQNIESVKMRHGVGNCQIGINRRLEVEGKIIMAPNPEGPCDPAVNVIAFYTATGRYKAVLTHYACHATTTGDNWVSGEFPGSACRLLEEKLGDAAVAAYLQGCTADVRPALIRQGEFYRGCEVDVQALGETLAQAVLDTLDQTMHDEPEGKLAAATLATPLLFSSVPSPDKLRQAAQDGIEKEWSTAMLCLPEKLCPTIPLEMTWFQFADSLSLLSFNGEMAAEYGLWLKEICQNRVLPVAYANGMIGYIPTETQLAEGGYEAGEAYRYFAMPAPFAAGTETAIKTAIANWCPSVSSLLVHSSYGGISI